MGTPQARELSSGLMQEGDELRGQILECQGHLLITGGPGAGKTTVALHKSLTYVMDGQLEPGQRILFLSFARATVARMVEASRRELPQEALKLIDIDTYHGFAWRLIRSHSYLTNGKSPRLLTPADVAALFADVPVEARERELHRLWNEEGLIAFDLFPVEADRILSMCQRLGQIYSSKYPLVVIDEFQDTSADQYAMIRSLAVRSQMIALADPEQRIYDFVGADPKRIAEFVDAYRPVIVDLGARNHRSGGTDITRFGNDILSGRNLGQTYNQVKIRSYPLGKGKASPHFALKTEVIAALKRLGANGNSWSLAILVPTHATMMLVAKYLSSTEDGLPSIGQQVHVDQEGPCLAASIIAGLLEGGTAAEVFELLLGQLRSHVRGRKGQRQSPSQADLGFAVSISDLSQIASIKKKDQRSSIEACRRIADACSGLEHKGAPEEDWRQVVELLRTEDDTRIAKVADDARYIRLLRRGSILRERLNDLWRRQGNYQGARNAVEAALVQLHFATDHEEARGLHLMTLHKSKGKEYDEVILYEDAYQGRLDHRGTATDLARARLVLRVGVTRARNRSTILTPSGNRRCSLL
jgi:DNA helicase-2/ATP-dependent DNA helicase PcrA